MRRSSSSSDLLEYCCAERPPGAHLHVRVGHAYREGHHLIVGGVPPCVYSGDGVVFVGCGPFRQRYLNDSAAAAAGDEGGFAIVVVTVRWSWSTAPIMA
jgi:hypothetical protein